MSAPRFYVVTLEGYAGTGGWTGARPTLTCSVLDRAYAHREVARYNEPTARVPGRNGYLSKDERRTWAREHAADEAARLNTWDASA